MIVILSVYPGFEKRSSFTPLHLEGKVPLEANASPTGFCVSESEARPEEDLRSISSSLFSLETMLVLLLLLLYLMLLIIVI
jgi:hypothetical protein